MPLSSRRQRYKPQGMKFKIWPLNSPEKRASRKPAHCRYREADIWLLIILGKRIGDFASLQFHYRREARFLHPLSVLIRDHGPRETSVVVSGHDSESQHRRRSLHNPCPTSVCFAAPCVPGELGHNSPCRISRTPCCFQRRLRECGR